MSEKFSPALRLADLNDFIAPSENCIVSLSSSSRPKSESLREKKDKDSYVGTKTQDEKVTISLKDCLACSGCVTSAETVMLEKQSLDEFLSHCRNSEEKVIVSVSPQSRASLASFFDLSPTQVFRKLTSLFKSAGVEAVYDTSSSRDLSLIESCNEFVSRYRKYESSGGKECKSNLPVLSSACPGWICYAEKTLGSFILPYISSVKSPQQVIGSAIKHHMVQKLGFKQAKQIWFSPELSLYSMIINEHLSKLHGASYNIRPSNVYHVTVMPCYDKKLEAVRDDFTFSMDQKNIAEVDSVLTTGEVLDLIQSKSIDFVALEEAPLDRMLTNVNAKGQLYGVPGGSGGYAETVFRHAAKVLFNREIDGPVQFRTLRNSDFREAVLEVDGKEVLKFAQCYGFRNLQNIVSKVKRGKCEYHFVEVMACPSGCLNGGGQIKPKKSQSGKELLQQLESLYMQDVLIASPFDNPIAKTLYDEWLGQPGYDNAKMFLHTEYHPVVKSIASQLHNW